MLMLACPLEKPLVRLLKWKQLARPQQKTLVHLLEHTIHPPPPAAPPNHHDAEGTNKGLDEGLLNPAPPLHDPPLPLFGFGDARPPVPVLHKEEDAEGGLLRLKQIGACRAAVPVRFGGGEAALSLRVGGGESGSRGRGIRLGPEGVVSGGLVGDRGRAEGGGGSEGSGE